jgi:sodium-dependent dicarboxylate transporter 2/3/5
MLVIYAWDFSNFGLTEHNEFATRNPAHVYCTGSLATNRNRMADSDNRAIFLFLGPVLAALAFFGLWSQGWEIIACWTGAVAALVATWWITEPIPIPATSLLPIALLPMFGVLTPGEVGASYGHPLVLLLMGGFILSTAMERSGAHRRIALNMVNLFGGTSSRRLVFGFMAASAVLSMWISNTATTLMLLPVALAVLERSEDKQLAIPLLLGIAYAASVGGIGTPIGTPPNLFFRTIYEQETGIEVGFLTWMSWGVPVVLLFVPIIGLWLTRRLNYQGAIEIPAVQGWTLEEKRVFFVFSLTALAWITRTQPFGGWKTWLDLPGANDASVALIAVVVMFLVPNGKGSQLLDWDTANKIPWGMLILFGGGIALARAFVESGLSAYLGNMLSGLATWHLIAMVLVICLTITFLTEMTSNTATTTLMMPILATAAFAADIDPALLMVPAAMSASCAFMLPVATAPNTIMFSTGSFPIKTMVREGFVLNLLGAGVITLVVVTMLG